MEHSTSTMPRRQLGRYLQQLRERGNLSVKTVSDLLDCSRQKIWRMEQGIGSVRPAEVQMLCDFYQASAEQTQMLIELTRPARVKGWWQAYDDIMPDWFEPYVMMEADAIRLRHYDGELVHGLLQTVPYMTEVIRAGRPDWTEEQRERRIELRQQRQKLLNRRGSVAPTLEFIFSESVLRRPLPDHRAMVDQLCHLIRLSEQPNVSLRILPLWTGPHAASIAGTFTILEFAQPRRQEGEPTVVYQEGPTGALYLDRPLEVSQYDAIWSGIEQVALPEGESRQLIASFAGEVR